MNTIETVEQPAVSEAVKAVETPKPTPAEVHFNGRVAWHSGYIEKSKRTLDWILANQDRLVGLSFDASCYSGEVGIECDVPSYGDPEAFERNPRAIARRFVGRVFIREKTPGECGSIDWVSKEIDGQPKITIQHAEKMEWKPVLTVDLGDEEKV